VAEPEEEAEAVQSLDVDGGGRKESKLLQQHEMFAILSCSLDALDAESPVIMLLGLAAVRSQCFLMKSGISENALNRCTLICALAPYQYLCKFSNFTKDCLPRKLDSRDSAYAMGGCILHFVTAAHRLRDHWKEI
jgi:hypothetical protein